MMYETTNTTSIYIAQTAEERESKFDGMVLPNGGLLCLTFRAAGNSTQALFYGLGSSSHG